MLTAFGHRGRASRIAPDWSGERLAQESSLTISAVSNVLELTGSVVRHLRVGVQKVGVVAL